MMVDLKSQRVKVEKIEGKNLGTVNLVNREGDREIEENQCCSVLTCLLFQEGSACFTKR